MCFIEFHKRHHKHAVKSYISELIFDNKTKIIGKIMATTFGKAQQVNYVIAFFAADGSVAPIQDGSLVITSSDSNICTVVPDQTNQLQGVVKGVNDGNATISWSGKSNGGNTVSGTADVTIADVVPIPEAVSTSITFSAPIPQ